MRSVTIHEVGLRDGLQAEKAIVPTSQKIAWAEALDESGVDVIQIGSFVNPEKVPQMGDTESVFRYFAENRPKKARLSALVLNEKGLDRGFAVGVDYFCMGVSASETHSRKNTGMGTEEATKRILAMAAKAREKGATVQLSVQSAFGCGYEGEIPQARVLGIVAQFLDAGFRQISLADTAGHATPQRVEEIYQSILGRAADAKLACHFHDTYGMALANCYAAWRAGVQSFEAAFGGLGGCPFTALSGGNVASEDLVHMFQQMDVREDIDLDRLCGVASSAEGFFGRELPGKIHRTGAIPHIAMQLG